MPSLKQPPAQCGGGLTGGCETKAVHPYCKTGDTEGREVSADGKSRRRRGKAGNRFLRFYFSRARSSWEDDGFSYVLTVCETLGFRWREADRS